MTETPLAPLPQLQVEENVLMKGGKPVIVDAEYDNASTWHKFLWNKSVEDFLAFSKDYPTAAIKRETMGKIKFVDREDTIAETLTILAENKILSAPVYDSDSNRFVGFIDVLDLVTHIVQETTHPSQQQPQQKQKRKGPVERGGPLPGWEQVRTQPCWLEHRVGPLIDASERNTWSPIDRRAPLIALFTALSRVDVHRVPIVDEKEPNPQWRVLAIVTQSQVMEWLHRIFGPAARKIPHSSQGTTADNISTPLPSSSLPSASSSTFYPFDVVRDLRLKDFSTPIIMPPDMLALCREQDDVMSAFEVMKQCDVSAVAVVDEDGRLLGNVSASDVRLVGSVSEIMDLLSMRLDKFLEFKGTFMKSLTERYSHATPISVFKDDTLSTALEKLVVNHIHRLWIVSDHKPSSTIISDTGDNVEAEDEIGGGGPRGEHIRQEDESSETGEIDRELQKIKKNKKKKRKSRAEGGFYPIGCLSLCDIINELTVFGTGNDRVVRRLRDEKEDPAEEEDWVDSEDDSEEDEGKGEDEEELTGIPK